MSFSRVLLFRGFPLREAQPFLKSSSKGFATLNRAPTLTRAYSTTKPNALITTITARTKICNALSQHKNDKERNLRGFMTSAQTPIYAPQSNKLSSKHSNDKVVEPCLSRQYDNGNINVSLVHGHESEQKSKAVVLLIGWMMSKDRQVKKFADWYHARDMDTVCVLPKPKHVLDVEEVKVFTNLLLSILENDDLKHHKIVVHGFSVGGYLYAQLLQRVIEAGKETEFKNRIQCQLFDSPVDIEGIPVGLSHSITSNETMRKAMEKTIQFTLKINKKAMQQYIKCSKIFKENPFKFPTHFFYSDKDHIACPDRIRSVVEGFEQHNIPTSTSVFHDSRHVLHMKHYPKKYFDDMGAFLESLKVI